MPFTPAALKSEFQNDPSSLGYAALLANRQDQDLADVINFVRDGSTPSPTNNVVGSAITIRRADVAVADVYAAIDVADYAALPTNPNATQLSTERRFLAWLTGLAAMALIRLVNNDGTDTPVIKNFKAMFANGTGTLTRLNALANRNGSRAEQLFGANARVAAADVAAALN